MKHFQVSLINIFCFLVLVVNASAQITIEPGTSNPTGITPLNGNGTLGNIYNVSKCGLNYVQASRKVTNRNSTGGSGSGLPCVLTISGIPSTCVTIEKAYLWYEESYNISPNVSSPANPNITVTNPASSVFNYVGTAVGVGGDKCWGEQGTRTFRIDVTNAITGNGNYTVNTTSASNEIDGMTLFIIYSDYTSAFQGTLIINDGIVTTNTGAYLTSQITGFTACGNSTAGTAFAIVGDGQYAGGAPNQSHEAILNGSPLTTFTDAFWNFDQLNTSVSSGQNFANYAVQPGQTVVLGVTVDCVSWLVEGLYYQTTTCTTCPVPLTLATSSTPGCGCNSSATVVPSGVSGPYTYSWAPSGGNAATANNLCAGTYTVTVTAAGGCVTNTATVTVTSNPAPTPTANNTGPYCAGQTIQLNSPTGSATDDWTGPGGYTSTNTQNPSIPNATTAMSGVYTVTVTNAFGCSATATTSVTVNAVTPASAGNTGTYCAGQTIQLSSAAGGTGYSWNGPGGYTSNVQNPSIPSSTVAMSGVYTVMITNASGCTSTATTTVTVNALPVAAASNTGPYCAGATIQLNGSGGTGYSWTGPAGFTSNIQNPSIPSSTVGMSGVYTVVVTAAGGCTASATTSVTVNNSVGATASNTGPYCAGSTINLSSGAGGTNYDWTGPGGYTSTNTQNPSIPNATTGMSGIYTVTVTFAGGCTGTATTTVAVNAVPTAGASNTGPYCEGSTIMLAGSGGSGYAWVGPSGYSSGVQNPSIPASTIAMSGVYTVTVTNAAGCTATATTTVTVNPVPVPSAGNTGPYCSGSTIQLNAGGGTTYNWTGPGGYASTNTQNPTIPNSTTVMSGTYTVTVSQPGGCSATATTTVTVNATPTAVANNTGPYCTGETIMLSSSGGISYAWTGPGGYTSNVQNPSITSSTPAMTGIYTVLVTAAGGCTATATTSVSVAGSLTVSANSNTPVCDGQSLNLSSTFIAGATYAWSGPGGYSANVQSPVINPANPSHSGTYSVTITNASGCTGTATVTVSVNSTPVAGASNTGPYCAGDTIYLNGTGVGTTFNWAGPGGYASTNTQNPAIINSTSSMSGNYTVTLTNASGCSSTASTNVVVNNLPNAFASNNSPACEGGTIDFNSGGGSDYDWTGPNGYSASDIQNPSIANVTQMDAGMYAVTVTDNNGCSSTATTTAIVNNNLVFTAGSNSPVCAGSPLNLNAQNIPGGVYTWSGPNGFTSNTQNPTIPSAIQSNAGTYTVTATNSNGCSGTTTTDVTIFGLPTVNFMTDVFTGCAPLCVNLTDQSTSSTSTLTGWNWSVETQGPFNTQNVNACFGAPGLYDVSLTVTDANGCSNTLNVPDYISVSPDPVASFTFTPGEIIPANPTITFTNTSVGATNYFWSFGDGGTSTLKDPVYTYSTIDTFCVSLVAINAAGCMDSTVTCIHYTPDFSFYIPNSFTPNGDESNNIFYVYGLGVRDLMVRIFDRWGREIYNFDHIDEGWNGNTLDGNPCQIGVYVYRVEVTDSQGRWHEYMGQVNLIR